MKTTMAKVALRVVLVSVLLLPCKCDDIKTSSGDVYDCVDLYKQPALLNPLLKDHEILMKPNVSFAGFPEEEEGSKENGGVRIEMEGGGCPQGTVPILRLPTNNNFTTSATPNQNASHPMQEPKNIELYSVMRSIPRHFYGASAKINAYGVHPIGYHQQSSAMIWLKNEDVPPPSDQIPIIQAGWSVYPELHGDYKTRLTAAWSRNSGRTTCYNYHCHGFVQVNRKLTLGADVWPLSGWLGPQYYLHTHIYKDEKGNWWVAIGDMGNVVGYFPAEIFGRNFDHASVVDFGGYVRCGKGEDCPPMGNGHKPYGMLWDRACTMRCAKVIGPDHHWGPLSIRKQYRFNTIPQCYGVGVSKLNTCAYNFPFGGPVCPASAMPPSLLA